ncbi:MAG: FAD-dependent oxidoreductase [Candidatus Cryptobacteroides sp.]
MPAYYTEPSRRLPLRAEVDTLVVGGGPAGLMAAQAAARGGKQKVMLIESRGYLGGNLTIGLPILAFLGPKGNQIIYGAAQDFIDRLRAQGAASEHKPCRLHMSLTIVDGEAVKRTAFQIMEESGVEVQLYTFVSDSIVEDGVLKGVIIESKAGREVIFARRVIDCSGDADVAYRAGVECRKGDSQGNMQPPTLMFSMRGVEVSALRSAITREPETYDMDRMPKEQFASGKFITVGLRGQIEKAKAAGLDIPVSRTILISGLDEDEIWVNMTRVCGTDSTIPENYTRCEMIAHRQIPLLVKYLRDYVPGFEKAWVDKVAPFTGIRESRVIVGKYVLTAEDILSGKSFPDPICMAGYPVDIHHASGGDCTMLFCEDAYPIPYRVLLPEKLEGLLVAGRCSSMNHEAMAATRVMSTCMALGEAAGTAARLSIEQGVMPSELAYSDLREALLEQKVYLG